MPCVLILFSVVFRLVTDVYMNCIVSRGLFNTSMKVNQSRYRPGVAQRVPTFPDFMTMAQGGSEVVSLTHWPPLPPGNAPGTHFC